MEKQRFLSTIGIIMRYVRPPPTILSLLFSFLMTTFRLYCDLLLLSSLAFVASLCKTNGACAFALVQHMCYGIGCAQSKTFFYVGSHISIHTLTTTSYRQFVGPTPIRLPFEIAIAYSMCRFVFLSPKPCAKNGRFKISQLTNSTSTGANKIMPSHSTWYRSSLSIPRRKEMCRREPLSAT